MDDLDDLLPLLPLLEVGDAVVGEASDSVAAVVSDEVFSDLGFFFRFLPSTAVGSSMVVAATAVMMSGDDNFILSDSDIILSVCRD